jgi:hypothetical protein
VRKLDVEGVTSGSWVDSESHWLSNSNFGSEKINLRRVSIEALERIIIRDLPYRMVEFCHSPLGQRK